MNGKLLQCIETSAPHRVADGQASSRSTARATAGNDGDPGGTPKDGRYPSRLSPSLRPLVPYGVAGERVEGLIEWRAIAKM